MSLGIAFKGSEGLVLAADSRVSISSRFPSGTEGETFLVASTYDNATKMLKLPSQTHIGAITFGLGTLGQGSPRTAFSYMPEFENTLIASGARRLSVEDFSMRLGTFFMEKWKATGMPEQTSDMMHFYVGGYDEGADYGRLFEVRVPEFTAPMEMMANNFGIIWGGQYDVAARLLNGYDSRALSLLAGSLEVESEQFKSLHTQFQGLAADIPYAMLPLQDCVDLSVFLIRTTIGLQSWQTGLRAVGGEIDVAMITSAEGFSFLQQKSVDVPK